MKFWSWLISWFRRKPEPKCPSCGTLLMKVGGDNEYVAVCVCATETMELMKPERTGKPQTYGEIQRQRSRVKHPRRH